MKLHQSVAETLGARRDDIVADLNNTEAAIEHVEQEILRGHATRKELLSEMRAIDYAVELLTNLTKNDA